MLAVDNSASSARASQEAAHIAALMKANVRVVYVVDKSALFNYGGYYDPQPLMDALFEQGRDALAHAHQTLRAAGVDDRQEIIETDDISDHVETALQRYALTCGADLVVMGTHGRRGVRRLVLGSVAERFLRFSTCPVVLVRAEEQEEAAQ
jgi:nucleotide-binding universal stress UspA family protein